MTDATITRLESPRRFRAVPKAPAPVEPTPPTPPVLADIRPAPAAVRLHLAELAVKVRRLQVSIGGDYAMARHIAEAKALFEQIAAQATAAAEALS